MGIGISRSEMPRKKSLNAERKDIQEKRISGKKMEKEDLLLWKRLFVAVEPAEVNVRYVSTPECGKKYSCGQC